MAHVETSYKSIYQVSSSEDSSNKHSKKEENSCSNRNEITVSARQFDEVIIIAVSDNNSTNSFNNSEEIPSNQSNDPNIQTNDNSSINNDSEILDLHSNHEHYYCNRKKTIILSISIMILILIVGLLIFFN